jgi:hypothetical protein
MAVILLRAYAGFATGANVTLDNATEAALVAQGLATYSSVPAINPASPPGVSLAQNQVAQAAITAGANGPAVITNIPIGGSALTGFETNGVAQVAFEINVTEIFVPHWNTWTGAALLNGTTVGTDSQVYWLFNSDGDLLANTAIAGTLNAGASVFQKIAFTAPITLAPGRYFLGAQLNGATATPRHVLAAFGAEPRCSEIAASASFAASLAALTAAPIAVPTTFTTAVAPIMQLYS